MYDPQDPVVPAKAEAPALAPTKAPTVQYPHVYNGSTGFSPRHGPTAQPENGFMGQAGTGFTGQTGNGFFAKPGFGPVQPGLGTTGQHGFYPGPAFTGPSGQTTFPGPSFGAPASQAKPTQSPPPAAAAPKPSAPVVEQRQHRGKFKILV